MRITTHPSQFVILNSNKQSVISNSIEILKHHAWIFDCMGFECDPNYAINIHGGAKGNRDILIASINSLPSNVRDRLTLENDERCFNVLELQDINLNTGIPIVLDTHHFSFNTGGISLDEAFKISSASWKNTNAKPLTHLSNTEPGMENAAFNKKRAHSLMVHYVPGRQRELNNSGEIDIEMEFKLKNIAALSAIDAFSLRRA
jgi:UV DNA damage endonuclease